MDNRHSGQGDNKINMAIEEEKKELEYNRCRNCSKYRDYIRGSECHTCNYKGVLVKALEKEIKEFGGLGTIEKREDFLVKKGVAVIWKRGGVREFAIRVSAVNPSWQELDDMIEGMDVLVKARKKAQALELEELETNV